MRDGMKLVWVVRSTLKYKDRGKWMTRRDKDVLAGSKVAGSNAWTQIWLLCWKNLLLALRSWRSSAVMVVTPILVVLLLVSFQQLSNIVTGASIPHPKAEEVEHISRCVPGYGMSRCDTVLFMPFTNNSDSLMRRVASKSGLTYSSAASDLNADIRPLSPAPKGGLDLRLVNVTLSDASAGECVVGTCDIAPTLDCLPCQFLLDNATLQDHLLANPNATQNAILFVGEYVSEVLEAPTNSWILYYNLSATQFPLFEKDHSTSVKIALDRARLEELAGEEVEVLVWQRPYPSPPSRIEGYDVVAASGAQWFFLCPMICFFFLVTEMVHEKERMVRLGMRVMGLQSIAFWLSWSLYGLTFLTIITAVLLISGSIANFSIFTNTDLGVLILLFLGFGASVMAMAFFFTTLLSSIKTAQTFAYAAILVSFVFESIISAGYGGLMDLLWYTDVPHWVLWVRAALSCYPPFFFAKIYYDIARLASSELDFKEGKVVKGPGFHWHDFTHAHDINFQGFNVTVPAPGASFLLMLADGLVFFLLAIYLDAVLPGPHGSPQHPLFFLGFGHRGRWCGRRRTWLVSCCGTVADDITKPKILPHPSSAPGAGTMRGRGEGGTILSLNAEESDVDRLRPLHERVGPVEYVDQAAFQDVGVQRSMNEAFDMSTPIPAVRLRNLKKVYTSWTIINMCRWSIRWIFSSLCPVNEVEEQVSSLHGAGSGSVTAVAGISLTLDTGSCCALLGHNGSGKSTTLNILTGLFHPSAGRAEILGIDVEEDVSGVQRILGVCPQQNILWEELTAREHLQFFARLKGLVGDIDEEVNKILQQVSLEGAADHSAGSFSGGMKRRLCIGMAAIGSPKLLLLDEASAGLDPVAKVEVWKLIQSLRADRCVILCTHDLAEALALADRTVIMAHGRLWAEGSPLELRKRWGHGYTLSVSVEPNPTTTSRFLESLRRRLPESSVARVDAGSLVLSVPMRAVDRLAEAMEWLETIEDDESGEEGLSGKVREFGVSLSTLEDVFHAVNARADTVITQVTGIRVLREDEAAELDTPHSDVGEGGGGAGSGGGGGGGGGGDGPVLSSTVSAKPRPEPVPSTTQRIYALATKTLTLQVRQTGLCLCQAITPLMIMGLLLLLSKVISSTIGKNNTSQLIPSLIQPISTQFGGLGATIDDNTHLHTFLNPSSPPPTQDSFIHESAGAPNSSSNSTWYEDCFLFFLVSASPNAPPFISGESPGRAPGNPTQKELEQLAGFRKPDGSETGLVSLVPWSNCTLPNGSSIAVPFFEPRSASKAAIAEIYDDLEILNNAPLDNVESLPPCEDEEKNCPGFILPDGSIEFNAITYPSPNTPAPQASSPPRFSLRYTVSVNDVEIVPYHRGNNFTRISGPYLPDFVKEQAVVIGPARLATMDAVTESYAQLAGLAQQSHGLMFNASFKAVATMPSVQTEDFGVIVQLFGSFLYPVALTLQMPLFVFVRVLEKETGLSELQRAMGVPTSLHLGVDFAVNFLLYLLVMGFLWISGIALDFRIFSQTSPALLVLVLFGWGLSLIGLANAVAACLNSRRLATVVGFITALFGSLIGVLMADGIWGITPAFPHPDPMPIPINIFPLFALCRAIYLLNYRCLAYNVCFTDLSEAIPPNSELWWVVLLLWVDAAVLLLLGYYFELVMPRKYGVSLHACFCAPPVARQCPNGVVPALRSVCSRPQPRSTARKDRDWKRGGYVTSDAEYTRDGENGDGMTAPLLASSTLHATPSSTSSSSSSSSSSSPLLPLFKYASTEDEARAAAEAESPAVTQERKELAKLLGHAKEVDRNPEKADQKAKVAASKYPLLVQSLRKVYDGATPGEPSKLAVEDVSFRVGAGETLGLLGSNGAGKSTTISMLSAALEPTGGCAWVGGSEVGRETAKVLDDVGICYQHERLWSDLSVEEHLRFFLRVKGVASKDEEAAIVESLHAVNLLSVRTRRAGALSGGMRRRLAIAISLAGMPKAAFLDEPSSSLDVGAKRQLWKALQRSRDRERAATGGKGAMGLILTTHAMDEAEALCQRIAIVTHGRVRVIGTPLELKSRYGQGYRLWTSYDVDVRDARDTVITFITHLFPTSSLDADFRGYLSFVIPASSSTSTSSLRASEIFQQMREHESECPVLSTWGAGQASLDDVFARVVHAYERFGPDDDVAQDKKE